ncbi:MAG: VPLPA-CTERM sorting domain-containing protein, partial [Proteobacteria bacterium]|nr:VPLPA-CTERM sorting domain-containing protein [Pseudomonadota bacterium]
LSGGEVIDVTDALLEIQLDLTLSNYGSFNLGVYVSAGDGIYLDSLVYSDPSNLEISDYIWYIDFSDITYSELALNAIEDKSFKVQLFSNIGSITNVDSSTLSGNFNIVPIPGAIWLLGSGIIGMVGIRRKFKK